MADMRFELSDHKNIVTLSEAYKIHTLNVDPDTGTAKPLKTTGATDPSPQKAITSFNMSEIMQGSAIVKPAIAPYDAYNQFLSGSLTQLLGTKQGNASTTLGNQSALVPDDVLQKAGVLGAQNANNTATTTSPTGTVTGANPAVGVADAESAIGWMKSNPPPPDGKSSWEGLCESAVEIALSGHKFWQASAASNWRSHTDQHTDKNPPRGAMVFWNTSSNGHVGLSLGDGTVISTSAKDNKNGIGVSPIDYFQNYLGWTGNNLIQQ